MKPIYANLPKSNNELFLNQFPVAHCAGTEMAPQAHAHFDVTLTPACANATRQRTLRAHVCYACICAKNTQFCTLAHTFDTSYALQQILQIRKTHDSRSSRRQRRFRQLCLLHTFSTAATTTTTTATAFFSFILDLNTPQSPQSATLRAHQPPTLPNLRPNRRTSSQRARTPRRTNNTLDTLSAEQLRNAT